MCKGIPWKCTLTYGFAIAVVFAVSALTLMNKDS